MSANRNLERLPPSHHWVRCGVRLCLIILLLAACDVPPSQRENWLRNTLIDDNRVFLEREPGLAVGKFRLMASTPYRFMRGTARQFWRDVSQPNSRIDAGTTHASAATDRTALVGDAHLENIGSYRLENGDIVIEFNDFDAAYYGGYYHDVRRLALSAEVATAQFQKQQLPGAPGVDEAASAVIDGYLGEVKAIAAGETPFVAAQGAGVVVDYLHKESREDGESQKYLRDYTRVEAGQRIMYWGEVDPQEMSGVIEDETQSVPPAREADLRSLVAAYARRIAAPVGKIKGMSRRFGAGVSSYPALRYYVLAEGASAAVDDDILLEVKEVGDAYVVADGISNANRDFTSNGERVAMMQQRMQANKQADRYLGHGDIGRLSFRVRHREGWQQGFRVAKLAEKIEEGDWTSADYLTFARQAGTLLARAHCLDAVVCQAIAKAVGTGETFKQETMAFQRAYVTLVLGDYQRFRKMLAKHGGALGYRSR